MIYSGNVGVPGQADTKIQAYNFRMCLSSDKSNQVPITKPSNYNSSVWELFRRYVSVVPPTSLSDLMIVSAMPNSKTDVNNNVGDMSRRANVPAHACIPR
jgi:hypothetical protein